MSKKAIGLRSELLGLCRKNLIVAKSIKRLIKSLF